MRILAVGLVAMGLLRAQTAAPGQEAQAAPPGQEAQAGELERLRALQTQFTEAQTKSQSEQRALQERVDALTSELSGMGKILAKATTVSPEQIKAFVETTNTRLGALEEKNTRAAVDAVNLDKLRYQTGKGVLRTIKSNLSHINFATGFGKSVGQLQRLANPAHNADFKESMARIQSNLNKGQNVQLPALVLANPYISLAYGITTLFSSKMNERQKSDELANLSCLLNFSTQATEDFRVVSANIELLDSSVRQLNKEVEDYFHVYAALVGYEKTWEEYLKEEAALGRDPLDGKIEQAFKKTTPEQLQAMRYNLERVKAFITRYNELLRQLENSIDTTRAKLQPYAGYQCNSKTFMKGEIDGVLGDIDQNRKDFRAAHYEIPVELISNLYAAR